MNKFDNTKATSYKANLDLMESKLVIQNFGNLSIRHENQIIIKPSGVNLKKISFNNMVSVNIFDGKYTGRLKPSSDTPTHIELYKNYSDIQSIAHTHSPYATSWAQAGFPIPCFGTTHADFWKDKIPITRKLKTTPLKSPGVLVNNHGVFTWGESSQDAIKNAEAIELIAKMAFNSLMINPDLKPVDKILHNKHFYRKHGENKYYGQE